LPAGWPSAESDFLFLGACFGPQKMRLSMLWRRANGIKLFAVKEISWSEHCVSYLLGQINDQSLRSLDGSQDYCIGTFNGRTVSGVQCFTVYG